MAEPALNLSNTAFFPFSLRMPQKVLLGWSNSNLGTPALMITAKRWRCRSQPSVTGTVAGKVSNFETGYWVSLKSTGVAIGAGLWETVSMAKKRTKLDRSQRQSDRSEKRLNGTRREAAKKNAREDVNQAVERIVRK